MTWGAAAALLVAGLVVGVQYGRREPLHSSSSRGGGRGAGAAVAGVLALGLMALDDRVAVLVVALVAGFSAGSIGTVVRRRRQARSSLDGGLPDLRHEPPGPTDAPGRRTDPAG